MATPSQKPKLTDYDVRLLELAHQLDAERREIILQFAQDLLQIGDEHELDSSESVIANETRH